MSSACRRSGRSSADCWGGWRRRGAKKFAQQQPRGIPARKSSPNNTPVSSLREKVRPAAAPSRPNREKTLPASPKTPKTGHFCRAGRTFSRFPIRITPQGELFRASRSESPRRANFFAQPQHATSNPRAPPARRAQESAHKKAHATKHPRQGTYTSATGRQLLVVHRSLLPLVVIHRLTRKA